MLPPEEKKIIRTLYLVKELVKMSEKDGPIQLSTLSSLQKGEWLSSLQINNSLKSGMDYFPKIDLACYSNITIWELKKVIGVNVSRMQDANGHCFFDQPVHPASIRLYRYAGAVDIKDTDNGKTLAELNFKANESLTAFRKNLYVGSREPLLNEYGNDLSDKAKAIVRGWFDKFAIDDPDRPGTKVMTPATVASFARTCTEDHLEVEDHRVQSIFDLYDPE